MQPDAVGATPKSEPSGNGVDQGVLLNGAAADAEILRLAGLPDLAYGRERKAAAEKLRLTVAWLDKLVKGKKAEIVAQAADDADSGGQGRAINLPEPEPWPQAVDGAALLSAITNDLLRHMVMEPGAAECVALWAVHTHALDAFGITPRLSITSPRPQCGKTTLLATDQLERDEVWLNRSASIWPCQHVVVFDSRIGLDVEASL